MFFLMKLEFSCRNWYLYSTLFFRYEEYFPMVYEYYKLAQILATNDTTYKKSDTVQSKVQQECREIMKNDIAIVKVRLESNKYMKTIKDKRLTFADKLSAFGKQSIIVKI